MERGNSFLVTAPLGAHRGRLILFSPAALREVRTVESPWDTSSEYTKYWCGTRVYYAMWVYYAVLRSEYTSVFEFGDSGSEIEGWSSIEPPSRDNVSLVV